MSLPVGTILEVRSFKKESFLEVIPYRGIYINTWSDTQMTFEPNWISLSPDSPLLKIFTDNDTMKQKIRTTAHSENMSVETLLELSDRIDDLEQEVTNLKACAITNAEDFLTKQNTFWYAKDTPGEGNPIELVFPSYSTLRFNSTYETDRNADLVITRNRASQLWGIISPVISVARVEENPSLPENALPSSQRKILGNDIACRGRFLDYDPSIGGFVDILSYTNESGEKIPISYPLGDNATFNDVEIRDGHTLYLSDPNARIKIKKPKEIS